MNPIDKIDNFYFRWLPPLLTAIGLSFLFVRLSMMQTEGLIAPGGAFVTFLVAMTSLLYGRARATTDQQETAKRSAIADECLKLSLFAAMGLVITAYTFVMLSESYLPRTGDPFGRDGGGAELAPMLAAFACLLLFGVPVFVKVRHVFEKVLENIDRTKIA